MLPTTLAVEPWGAQQAHWPEAGRHILAQYDERSIVVYQAYNPAIAEFAADHGRLAGAPGFGLGRMSWVKPNFLWMMYRSGWARKPGQERVLAIRVDRDFFDSVLAAAAWTTFESGVHATEAEWRAQLAASPVRLQWDPDHGPGGDPLARRAVQLGLAGKVLEEFAFTAIRSIEDVTPFVHAQDEIRRSAGGDLATPRERVYPVADGTTARRLMLGPA